MINFDLRVDENLWHQVPGLKNVIERAFAAIESILDRPGEVSLLLTNDLEMQRLNSQFRDRDKPTDVLSFPANPMDLPLLGDIAIGYQICQKDAETARKTLLDHLSHLLIHGFLHLLGYDHLDSKGAEEMEALERSALASLGIADPYSAA